MIYYRLPKNPSTRVRESSNSSKYFLIVFCIFGLFLLSIQSKAATVTLGVLNTPNEIGEIVIVKGDLIEVEFQVDDPNGELSKNDRIRLVRTDNNEVISKKKRGNSLAGNVSLKARSRWALSSLRVEYVHADAIVAIAPEEILVVGDDSTLALSEQIANLQIQINALGQVPANLQAQIDALNALVKTDALGNTIVSSITGNVMLDAGPGKEVQIEDKTMMMADVQVMGSTQLEGNTTIMQKATVMGDTQIEGATMMMSNAQVMGTTQLEGDTTMMQKATVMGETQIEGNAKMMQDATVMGATMLEGDAMMMQNAMVMGDALLESETNVAGTFVQPFATATVLSETLVPDGGGLSSSIAITERDSPLESIPDATVEGTVLTLKWLPDSGQSGRLPVNSCVFIGGCSSPINISLKPNSASFRMSPGDFLTVIWNGSNWEEVARSSGQGALAILETQNISINPGSTMNPLIACDPEAGEFGAGPNLIIPNGGIPNSPILSGRVEVISGSINSSAELISLSDNPVPGGGGAQIERESIEAFSASITNNGVSVATFKLIARCLVL